MASLGSLLDLDIQLTFQFLKQLEGHEMPLFQDSMTKKI